MNTSDKEPSELDTADDAALNDYLRRDSAVSQRYREVVADAVPASLDHAVLAQAKSAVAEKKVSRWRGVTRWSAPLALAASVVVVVSIVRQPAMQEEMVRTAAPVSAPAAPASAPLHYEMPKEAAPERAENLARTDEKEARMLMQVAPEPKPAPPAQPPESIREKKAELDRSVRDHVVSTAQQLSVQSVTIPSPPPVDAAPASNADIAHTIAMTRNDAAVADRRQAVPISNDSDLSEVIVAAQIRKPTASNGAGPRGTVAAVPKSDAPIDAAFSEDEPPSWLQHIRKLRSDGWTLRADAEWLRFRQKYPDFVVDEADTARPPR